MSESERLEDLARSHQLLLGRVDETYRLLHESRRRLAMFTLIMTVVFAAVAAQFAVRYFDARQAADAIEDRALFEGLGIRIPDPEPALLRIELRARATINGFLALAAGGVAALWLLATLIAAPPRRARPITAAPKPVLAPDEPPQAGEPGLSRRSSTSTWTGGQSQGR